MPAVRRARDDDVDALAMMLAAAFVDDAVASFVFPNRATRIARLVPFFVIQLRHVYLARGEIYTTESREGVAMWIGPNAPPISGRDALGQLGLLRLVGRRFLLTQRLARFLIHRHPTEPHYYLGTLGVHPDSQRQGVATSLLRPVLAQCDAEGLIAYLECSTEAARALYEGNDFVVREEVMPPMGGPRLWLMSRAPILVTQGEFDLSS